MLHFYDGQIRRYITQTIRVLSHFSVKYADGSLVRVPVLYGDADRQVAAIMRQNSENKINSVPRISVYVTDLQLDKDRLSDSTYVGKVHIRERDIVAGQYTQGQGKNYTVERLMPTPFKLTMKVDIWAANTDQRLQILEQMLVLFNPSLELQTTDNYIDWTSLSVLNLGSVVWTSKTVPVGADTPIDISTLTLDTPIWISPPVKVKHLGVITNIIASLYQSGAHETTEYLDGLGQPLAGPGETLSGVLSKDHVTVTGYHILVINNTVTLLGKNENAVPAEPTLEIPIRQGSSVTWTEVFDKTSGKYVAGSSMIYLTQANGSEVVGTIAINPADETQLIVNWDADTLITNTGIDSNGKIETVDPDYNQSNSLRASPGNFDAIVDPSTKGPRGSGLPAPTTGMRYLIIDDIGADINVDGADAWKGDDGSDLVAHANDIIEWNGTKWVVIFNSSQIDDAIVYQTNIYTGVQYIWNGVNWAKAFEGDYRTGLWRIIL